MRAFLIVGMVLMVAALVLSFVDPNVAWTSLGILGGMIYGFFYALWEIDRQ